MPFTKTQYSFAAGELAPELYGRTDLEKSDSAVAVAQNMLLHEQGGLFSRPGMRLVAVRKYAQDGVALVKFVFSPTDNCVVEFGEKYIRFVGKNGYQTKNGKVYELASPFTKEDLKFLTFDQSGDVLFLACAGKPPYTLTRKAADNWLLEIYKNTHGPFDTYNGDRAALTLEADGRLLLTQMSAYQFTKEDEGGYFKLEKDFEAKSLSFTQTNAATAAELLKQVFACAGTWQLDTTGSWTGTIRVEQSSDGVSWKAYRSYSSTLFKIGDSATGQNFNSNGEISGEIKFLRINATNWTAGTAYIQLRLPAFTYNLFGRIDEVKAPAQAYVSLDNYPPAQNRSLAGSVEYLNYDLPAMSANAQPEGRAFYVEPGYQGAITHEDGTVLTTYDTAYKARDNDPNTCALLPVFTYTDGLKLGYEFNAPKLMTQLTARISLPTAGAWQMKGYVYSKTAGWKEAGTCEFDANSPNMQTLHFDPVIVDGFAVSFKCAGTEAPTAAEVRVYELTANTKTVALSADIMKFYAPRWGKRQGWPSEVRFFQARLAWFNGFHAELTKTDDYYNFEMSLKVKDDDAISANLKSTGMCSVRHAIGARKLMVLTDGGEFVNTAEVLTPAQSGFAQQSNYGCAWVRPVLVGPRVLFVTLMGGRLCDLQYDYSSDNYQAEDLCALAPHLFEGRQIVQLDYQSDPTGLVWVVLDNGVLLSLSYARQHGLLAWTRHTTQGEVEQVCVLPDERENRVFLAVKRGNVRTIEVLATQLPTAREKAFYVDSGVHKTFEVPTQTVDGLAHLEGRRVAILADGNVEPEQTVQNGQITLTRPATTVAAGLPFVRLVKTLPLCVSGQNGEFINRLRPVCAQVGLKSSAGGYAGADGQKADPLFYATDTELFTGMVRFNISATHEEHPQICLYGLEPLPLNITKLVVQYA
ncbi:MAG: hypothetical protein SOT02_00525 [Elusimicrobiaceae bacterium]|uniref:hypothetical protein n=1 Tax=Candidatus Avelusimicrobium faecicola TaxID=3416205 RepID=UPI002A76CEA2|nr:hypothetical protein [Spirochaetota bacterium]MDY2939432.1 hypothetical protein [Elusimicrobiaceae bacterium]